MTTFASEWLLVPDLHSGPHDFIQLGNIIQDPGQTYAVLTRLSPAELEAKYPAIAEDMPEGYWTQMVTQIAGRFEARYHVDGLSRTQFEGLPAGREVRARLANPAIRAIMRHESSWDSSGRCKFYMVTGIRAVKDLQIYGLYRGDGEGGVDARYQPPIDVTVAYQLAEIVISQTGGFQVRYYSSAHPEEEALSSTWWRDERWLALLVFLLELAE
ncbi:uncharacterized protein BP01DRAFT_369675 [Aspergillus saccharolyticus JOP 1030-1]|uniref:Uncharacterized protein n=1 Tax=Aspergillus saccharolyticus JOP 1030-1 TaxID=1450539 RepID=A0A318ZKF6_9EURO|nr:hypothetical protein BP01DRAFT_369675 [Aspergillus saccharolyticus JOP 1030-1]PYH40718.1 hypothetical protein BP01DRAFT_369675 [Aspergillus saccharolyticus JOP 1030-1]